MMKTHSIKDVARIAKVSTATVSRVINNSNLVDSWTRDRVLKVIKKLDYHPNLVARSLIRGKSNLLTLIVPPEPNFFSAFYFRQILCGISHSLSKYPYRMMIYQPEGYDPKLGYPPHLDGFPMDGIFVIAPLLEDRLVKHLEKEKTPVVLINARSHVLDWIDLDNVSSAREVVLALSKMGHTRIGFINGLEGYNANARLEGYKLGLEKSGLSYDPQLVTNGDYSLEKGFTAAKKLLSHSRKPTVIFAANDLMAIGAIRAAHELGFSVPRELSIFGFDDSDAATLSQPQLSTVRQPFFEMGERATDFLVSRVENLKLPQKTIELPGQLVFRQSSKEKGKN